MKQQTAAARPGLPSYRPNPDDVKTLKAFLARYPDLANEKQIRWQIFRRLENGLADSGAINKRGGKWFVCVPRYIDWLMGLDSAA